MKTWLIWKDPEAGKDWGQEEKGTTEDEMVGWHHWLNGHEFEQAPGVGDGQGSLACCSPGSCKESDTAERLNWIGDLILIFCNYILESITWGEGLVGETLVSSMFDYEVSNIQKSCKNFTENIHTPTTSVVPLTVYFTCFSHIYPSFYSFINPLYLLNE